MAIVSDPSRCIYGNRLLNFNSFKNSSPVGNARSVGDLAVGDHGILKGWNVTSSSSWSVLPYQLTVEQNPRSCMTLLILHSIFSTCDRCGVECMTFKGISIIQSRIKNEVGLKSEKSWRIFIPAAIRLYINTHCFCNGDYGIKSKHEDCGMLEPVRAKECLLNWNQKICSQHLWLHCREEYLGERVSRGLENSSMFVVSLLSPATQSCWNASL